MRIHIPCTALGLAVAAFVPAAHAETIVTRQTVSQPVETVRTVRTVTTTRTIRPVIHRKVVVTHRITVGERVVPRPAYDVAPAPAPVVPAPAPIYDVVAPAPAIAAPAPVYDDDYDDVAPGPALAAPVVDVAPGPPLVDQAVGPVPPVGIAVPTYQYVYQPDRILVIDPATGIAVQALPR
jgi:hypothetical protein